MRRGESRAKGGVPEAVQACHELLRWLIPHLDKFPRSRRFTLGERLEAGLLEVLEHLVDASYRTDRADALQASNRRLSVVRHLWRLCHELHVIPAQRYAFGAEAIDGIGRQIGGWLRAAPGASS